MWSSQKLKEKLDAASSHAAKFEIEHVEKWTESAVLVPIVVRNDVPFVLLTIRSNNLTNYPGQVSFPGGKREPADSSLVATALRETMEEIGLCEDNLTVVGSLAQFSTRTNFLVTPVVAIVVDFENFHHKLNPLEVCETFIVPLENFIKQECHKCKNGVFEGKEIILDYFEFSQEGNFHMIWGLTAEILTLVASLLFDRRPGFKYQDWLIDSNDINNQIKHIYTSTKSRL